VKRYLLDGSGSPPYVTAYSQYDIAGNVVKLIDPRSTSTNIIATTFSFSDCFGTPNDGSLTNSGATELGSGQSYAFPTTVTNALSQSVHLQYDFHLGRPVKAEDANGILSKTFYDDLLDRPTKGIRAVNAGTDVTSQTLIEYDDPNRTITQKTDQTSFNDQALKGATVYDGLGRTVQTRQYETSTQYIAVDQIPFTRLQDPDTQAWTSAARSSNPYRSGETPVWNTSFSDSLGRVTKVRTPDNAIVRTVYSGNIVTVTDQANKSRKTVTDAAGRLRKVYEDPTVLNYLTDYTYDALDDLTGVSQYDSVSATTQTRTFTSISLKRLLSATNPESGTISYEYDENGNLKLKVDPRLLPNTQTHVQTTYGYDDLNRVTSRKL
jgi:YD repeat-containing protein